ncbi:4-hydroxyphenylpyruvate dioxygenase [Rhodospirillum centenum]|uniref:4-hydroxyphenylpyruvate dioxygenase n=1 Tax=Rhodospirillum centenum (strain ATCC 51521 / SW) TaxID=414684 RepID=B6IWM9_RHOCS|nr:4-hydroxyphenylpyruvate dioxygenase [Rhodospirillum centenum]ACJ00703.1 4-hydroxyphenylpyruvate dioxygenase [Rhodospirillum centenum SW]
MTTATARRDEADRTDGDLWENPMGTDGFEFVEFAAEDTGALDRLFVAMGFTQVARHRTKDVGLYRQGGITFILNGEKTGRAAEFARAHGPGACAMAFRVRDAAAALRRAVEMGATPVAPEAGPMELTLPAIEGIGGSLLYLVDRYDGHPSGAPTLYDMDFVPLPGVDQRPAGAGLQVIDHLTHNVRKGRMDHFADFYGRLFNFRQIRYFDITGEYTGLTSRALTAPCGRIRIPINESKSEPGSDRVDQIQEFIEQYRGEGIQHVALLTQDILKTWDALKEAGVRFMTPPPETYYEMLEERLPGHGQPVEELRRRGILLDGKDGKYLLQIFTETVIGPIFFEIIQRKGDEGFGEGNFKALFESMERDQIRRGVLKVAE